MVSISTLLESLRSLEQAMETHGALSLCAWVCGPSSQGTCLSFSLTTFMENKETYRLSQC
jgi:hypothetical protein